MNLRHTIHALIATHAPEGDIPLPGSGNTAARWQLFMPAMRLRTVVEATVQRVLHRAANMLGAGPACRDARLSALYADLPVFLRQSHAGHDLAARGTAISHADNGYAR